MKFLMVFLSFVIFGCSTKRDPAIDQLYSLGVQQMQSGEYHNAIRNFRQVIKSDPADINAYNNLGIVYASINESQESEKIFKEAIAIQPRNTQLKLNLGQLYKTTKRYLESEKLLVDASNDQDFFDRPKALYELGELYVQIGKRDQAISTLEKASKLDLGSCSTHYLLGKIYHQQAKMASAIKSLEKASSGSCVRNRQALILLGDVYWQNKKNEKAILVWEKVIKLFSGEDVAKLAQQRLNSSQR